MLKYQLAVVDYYKNVHSGGLSNAECDKEQARMDAAFEGITDKIDDNFLSDTNIVYQPIAANVIAKAKKSGPIAAADAECAKSPYAYVWAKELQDQFNFKKFNQSFSFTL